MSTHDKLVEAAKEAINAVFSDQTVDQEQVLESLEELQSEIEIDIDSLDV